MLHISWHECTEMSLVLGRGALHNANLGDVLHYHALLEAGPLVTLLVVLTDNLAAVRLVPPEK